MFCLRGVILSLISCLLNYCRTNEILNLISNDEFCHELLLLTVIVYFFADFCFWFTDTENHSSKFIFVWFPESFNCLKMYLISLISLQNFTKRFFSIYFSKVGLQQMNRWKKLPGCLKKKNSVAMVNIYIFFFIFLNVFFLI